MEIDAVAEPQGLEILRQYAEGKISAREAARALGPDATEHDVFAGIAAAGLSLPLPPAAEIARQVADLHRFYGPHGPQ